VAPQRNGPSARAAAKLSERLTSRFLRWYDRSHRELPWRGRRDPYRTWVAEVILQQTRVAQAVPVFERFVERFPDVRSLGRAPREQVLKAWEGAGYYARARNLHEAARRILRDGRATWPTTREGWRKLPGVGPYIAAAVATIAFGEPGVALDANVRRVAARWTLETRDPRSAAVAGDLGRALQPLSPPDRPGDFQEALMELGETICLPRDPECGRCPVAAFCRARHELPDPGELPRRPAREKGPHVVAALVALERAGTWLVHRRPPRGLLGGLWEFPGGKLEPGESPGSAAHRELLEETGWRSVDLVELGTVRHAYSHFSVTLHVFGGRLSPAARRRPGGRSFRWVTRAEFERLPRPMATQKAARLIPGLDPGGASRGSGSRRGRTRP